MQRNGEPKEILELNRITKKRILELCKKNKLYQTPELNDVLYLHYQGFESIECLEDYTELKCLWLECNAISEIQGLKKQPKLKCLFLQSNLIRKIENLEYCKELDTINLSQNQIRKIENCGYEILPALNTLNLSSNYIKDCEGLKELENCKNLSVLDLSNNRIDDILVVKIFSKMPELKVLVLQGNPVVSKIPQYRKTLILECKKLTYLDSRPVFPKDRACAEAWKRGGYQEERKENERWNRKERKKMRDGVNATIQLRNKNRKPEDLISLIPSSDSEDDTHVRNQNKPITENSDVIIDSIWDEVSDDKYSESSVTQKSTDGSPESFISESKSTLESIKQDERNNLNDYNEEASKLSEKHNIDVKLDKNCESIDHKQKQIEIQKSDQDFEATELYGTNNEISSIETDMNHYYTSTDTHAVSDEKYQSSFEATHCLPKSENLSESSFKRIKLYIENDLVDTENYKPLKELEETMNILETYEGDGESSASLKLQNEEECLKINQELRKDFEKLSKNMDNSVEQLDRDKDERKEFNQVLFNKNQSSPKRKSESSGNELMDHNIKGNNLEVTINRLDKKCKLKESQVGAKLSQIIINDEKTIANREELIKGIQNPNDMHMQQFIRKKDHEEETIESRLCATDTFSKQDSIKLIDSNTNTKLKESNIKLREENSEADIFALQTTSSLLINRSQKPDNSDDFSYIPLNISLLNYKSNEALNSFENEANELKKLLHKLETQNEILFNDINTEDKCQTEEYNQENNKEYNEENKMSKNKSFNENDEKSFGNINDNDNISALEPNTCHETNLDKLLEPVISLILDEIIQSLELASLQPRQNEFQKSIEFEEAYNCPETVRHPINETNSESIPMLMKSYRQFFKDINNENFREFKKDKQKSLVLKRMTKQTDLKRFHNESPECLNAQLEKFRREQNANIRHMIDRVYAQKDRYNDTLELNDEKLMVRNKDTGELQELSKPLKYHMNNSDTDYDTAQSEDEEDKAKYQSLESSQANCKTYRSPTFNTSESLITRAICENNLLRDNDNSEDSNDEFYSLEAQDKPNLCNIDREFFNKLQLEDLNISEIDENHIVQCSRSYEELKQYLKISKEKRCLSVEENELFENMIGKKSIKPNENSRISKNFFEIKEQKWFDKMIRNTNERQKQGNMETLSDVSHKPSSSGIKIFEYKNDTSVQTSFPSQWEELYKDLDTNITTEMYGSGVYTFTYKNLKEETANKYEVDKNELYVSKISDEENIPQKISSYLSTVDIGEEEDGEIESNVDVESVRSVIKKMN